MTWLSSTSNALDEGIACAACLSSRSSACGSTRGVGLAASRYGDSSATSLAAASTTPFSRACRNASAACIGLVCGCARGYGSAASVGRVVGVAGESTYSAGYQAANVMIPDENTVKPSYACLA